MVLFEKYTKLLETQFSKRFESVSLPLSLWRITDTFTMIDYTTRRPYTDDVGSH